AGRSKSGRGFASFQQSAALQLHEVTGCSDRLADQLAKAFGLNFHKGVLKNGISRMILPAANRAEGSEDDDISLWKKEEQKGNEDNKVFSNSSNSVSFISF